MDLINQISNYLQLHWIDLIGYAASFFVAATFYMKTIIPLRILAIISNVLFVTYGFLLGVYPILILHLFLFPLNIIRLREMKKLISDVKSAIHNDDGAVEPLLPYMSKLTMKKGDVLFEKGEKADAMYYIKSGSITLVDLDIKVGENQLIGEMGIFSPFNERTDTAVCNCDMDIFIIDEDKVNQLYYQNPEFGFYLIRLLTKRFILNAQKN